MRSLRTTAFALLLLLLPGRSLAQTPTGVLTGVVTDASGAILPGVLIQIKNSETGLPRSAITSADGRFRLLLLPPGQYQLTAAAPGFKTSKSVALLQAGTITTANLQLELGAVTETVSVILTAPLLNHEQQQLGGVITREQIERLPLNGRSALELAKLEPGGTGLVRAAGNLWFVPLLGSGLPAIPRVGGTAVTVDGGSVVGIGTNGVGLQVSQEAVQEFQVATVNFDAATGATSNTTINIVTRSGGNVWRSDGFLFYRDHNLSAYPSRVRDPSVPDPFFRRGQFGSSLGGPVRRERVLLFASYERSDVHGVESRQPTQFPALAGIFASTSTANQVTARVDIRLGRGQTAFVRHTHEDNRSFAPTGGPLSPILLPSAWTRATNERDQTMAAVTTTIGGGVVNDARLSFFFGSAPERPAGPAECAGCIGLGAPRFIVPGQMAIGSARTVSGAGGRFQITDTVVWATGPHQFRGGVDWEHSSGSAFAIDNDQAVITLFTPDQARAAGVPVPATFTTLDDVLQLPLRSFTTSVGSGAVPRRNFGTARILDFYRLFVGDTWRAGRGVSINLGLGWSYEPNALNIDLDKPTLLAPLLGVDGLHAPTAERTNFSPTAGIAWTVTADNKTVIRAGVGRYYDRMASTNAGDLSSERVSLLPLGTGRQTFSGANLTLNGQTFNFSTPTSFRGAALVAALPDIRSTLPPLDPDNRDFSVRNIDRIKESSNLSDPVYRTPSAVHVSAGVQRALSHDVVVSADVVWRRFTHTFISGIDYNHFSSPSGPVIPKCTSAQRDDVTVVCSNGPMLFTNTSGQARYRGLLVRVEKRMSHRTQFLASYALGSWVGTNGTGVGAGFNNNDWRENYGPLPSDVRHVLNVSGFIDLPLRFQAGVSIAAYSRPPLSAYANLKDFNGDGTQSDLLPGTTVNQLGRGIDKAALERLVADYNVQHPTAPITLPSAYAFNDTFCTVDLRLTRIFDFGPRKARLSLVFEVFNLFNTKNLTGYSGDLTSKDFGQPTDRFTQVFGSGGARAAQLGARIGF